ncbi:NAD-dependent deacylase [Verrucomicrobiaceae bacterium 227]
MIGQLPITVKSIVILTGAGISAESGLKTFRDSGGLWEGRSVEEVATIEAFEKDPETVNRFYNDRRKQLSEVSPNKAHLALARLKEHLGDALTLITQNVDDLHERAGSKNVLHMHGELLRKKCLWCHAGSDCHEDILRTDICSNCKRDGGMRPDIVWFGEIPKYLDEIGSALASATHFISIGTSGHVYPAAGFVETAKRHGAHALELNAESTQKSTLFDETRTGMATQVVPAFVEDILKTAQ